MAFTGRTLRRATNAITQQSSFFNAYPLALLFGRWASSGPGASEGVQKCLDRLGISMEKWKSTCEIWGLKGSAGNLSENLQVLEEWDIDLDVQRHAVLETPLMLNIRGAELNKKMEWMVKEMGFCRNEVREIVRCWPKFLVMYPAEDVAPILKEFTRNEYTLRQVKEMVLKHPPVLGSRDNFTTRRRVFEAYLNLHPDAFHAMVLRCPKIINLPDSCLRPAVECLIDNGFPRKVACFMIRKAPEILLLSREEVNPQIMNYHGLGLSKEEVTKALREYPDLLWVDFDDRIQPVISWLSENLEDVKITMVVKVCPWLLLRPLEQLKQTYTWFDKVGMSVEAAKQMCSQGPHVLAVDPRQLDRMLEFAKDVLGKSEAQIFESTSYFSYSFEKRILARVAWLDFLNVEYRDIELEQLVAQPRQPFETKYWAPSIKSFQKKFNDLTLDKKLAAINSHCYP